MQPSMIVSGGVKLNPISFENNHATLEYTHVPSDPGSRHEGLAGVPNGGFGLYPESNVTSSSTSTVFRLDELGVPYVGSHPTL